MVSKKVLTTLVIVALLLAVFSMIISMSVSNIKKIPGAELNSNADISPDTDTGQVSIIINKPSHAP